MSHPARTGDETHPAPEHQLAALREEISRAGSMTRRLRIEIVLVAVLFVVLAAIWAIGTPSPRNAGSKLLVSNQVSGVVALLGMAGVLGALPIAAGVRQIRRRQLRERLRQLPLEERMAVLAPLRTSQVEDTWKLAEALDADLGLPTELTPAGTVEGNGAEVRGAPDTRTEASGCKEGRVPEQDVFERVNDVILRVFGGRPERVTRSSPLIKEFDSIFLEDVLLVEALEQEFGIPLPDEATEGMTTVGDMVAYIQSQLGQASEPSPTPAPTSCGDKATPAP